MTAFYRGPYHPTGIVSVVVSDFAFIGGLCVPDLETWFQGPLNQIRTSSVRAQNGRLFTAYYHELPGLGSARGVTTYEALVFRTHHIIGFGRKLENLAGGDESTSAKLLIS